MLAGGRAQLRVALPVLLAAQQQQIMPAEQALDILRSNAVFSAAPILGGVGRQPSLRCGLAAGTLGSRNWCAADQDLASEAETLDKAIIAAVSKGGQARVAATEEPGTGSRSLPPSGSLQKTFAVEFPISRVVESAAAEGQRRCSAVVGNECAGAVRRWRTRKATVRDDARSRRLAVASIRRGQPYRKGCRVPPRLDMARECDASGKSGCRSGAATNSMARCWRGRSGWSRTSRRCWWCRRRVTGAAVPPAGGEKPAARSRIKFEGYRERLAAEASGGVVLPSAASLKTLRFSRARNKAQAMTAWVPCSIRL